MNCELVQRQLLSSDAPVAPAAELRRHLAECPSCRLWHEQLVQVEQQLPALPVPPSRRKAEVVRQFLEAAGDGSTNGSVPTFAPILAFSKPSPRERGLRKASLAIAMAAGLAVFALGWWAWQQQPPPPTPPPNPLTLLRTQRDEQLRQAATKPEKLDVVARLAAQQLQEAATLARHDEVGKLEYTAQFYTELVGSDLPRYARELSPAERQKLLVVVQQQLQETESSLRHLLDDDPAKVAQRSRRHLEKMADEARKSQLQVQHILRGEV